MNQYALELEGVRKEFRRWGQKVVALGNIDLQVPTGKIFGFLGPNGAGKTTLIKTILGMIRPDKGRIRILGRCTGDLSALRQVGYLPERPYYYDFLTGQEFLEFHGTLAGMNRSALRTRIPSLLERVGLGGKEGIRLREYSKGMLQRIGFAQALIHDPHLLILDEPMSGLDPVGRREIRDLIQQVAGEGRTVFFSTHIVSDVELLCHEVAFIDRGNLRRIELSHPGLAALVMEHRVVFRKDGQVHSRVVVDSEGQGRLHLTLSELVGSGAQIVSVQELSSSLEQVLFPEIKKP